MQTILGSGGAIGAPLAKELSHYDKHIRLVSRTPTKVNDTDELFAADLCNPTETALAIAGSSVVYLCVGLKYDIRIWRKKWPLIMNNVIQACLKHHTVLVFVDNVYMYAKRSLPHMLENAPLQPTSEKGKVRKQLVDMLFKAIDEDNLQACIARSADFYGPGIENSLLLELVYKNLKNNKLAIWQRSKNKIHSFTYTPDAAKAIAKLGNSREALGKVWHLPTSKEKLTGDDWIKLFATALHKKPKTIVLPHWLMKIAGWFSPLMRELDEMSYQYQSDYFFDSSNFETTFHIYPTDAATAIKEIVKY